MGLTACLHGVVVVGAGVGLGLQALQFACQRQVVGRVERSGVVRIGLTQEPLVQLGVDRRASTGQVGMGQRAWTTGRWRLVRAGQIEPFGGQAVAGVVGLVGHTRAAGIAHQPDPVTRLLHIGLLQLQGQAAIELAQFMAQRLRQTPQPHLAGIPVGLGGLHEAVEGAGHDRGPHRVAVGPDRTQPHQGTHAGVQCGQFGLHQRLQLLEHALELDLLGELGLVHQAQQGRVGAQRQGGGVGIVIVGRPGRPELLRIRPGPCSAVADQSGPGRGLAGGHHDVAAAGARPDQALDHGFQAAADHAGRLGLHLVETLLQQGRPRVHGGIRCVRVSIEHPNRYP